MSHAAATELASGKYVLTGCSCPIFNYRKLVFTIISIVREGSISHYISRSISLSQHTEALSKHSIICANENPIQTACYREGFSAATAITHNNARLTVKEQAFMNASFYGEILAFPKKCLREMSLWINKTNESLPLGSDLIYKIK